MFNLRRLTIKMCLTSYPVSLMERFVKIVNGIQWLNSIFILKTPDHRHGPKCATNLVNTE